MKTFSTSQTCLIMTLTVGATIIVCCAALIALPLIFGPPPDRPLFEFSTPPRVVNQPTIETHTNQTRDGLILTGVRLSPFVPDVAFADPGPGNWWQLDATFYNPGKKPLTVSGYDMVLKDAEGREFWYDRGNSFFWTEGNLVAQLNPGVTSQVSIVFDLPQQISGLSLHYNGANLPINEEQIAR